MSRYYQNANALNHVESVTKVGQCPPVCLRMILGGRRQGDALIDFCHRFPRCCERLVGDPEVGTWSKSRLLGDCQSVSDAGGTSPPGQSFGQLAEDTARSKWSQRALTPEVIQLTVNREAAHRDFRKGSKAGHPVVRKSEDHRPSRQADNHRSIGTGDLNMLLHLIHDHRVPGPLAETVRVQCAFVGKGSRDLCVILGAPTLYSA